MSQRPILWALGTAGTVALGAVAFSQRAAGTLGIDAPAVSVAQTARAAAINPTLTVAADHRGHYLVRPEIDRYAVTPGQACSYMVGRVEIQRMRAEAQARQGEGFSVKAFHSAVLDSGSLPLGVLDDVVRARLP